MGTPLADALANYRDQLAPATEPGARPRRWRWWLLLVLTVVVLGVGGGLALRAGDSPTPGAGPPVAGAADLAPNTGPTPSAAPSDAPVGAQTLATPPASGWVVWESPVVRTWLPRVPGAGPSDPPATGFAHTPQGALAAAATLYPLAYYSAPQAAWAQIADTRVQWATGQRELLAGALARVWDAQVTEALVLSPVGYRVITYSADRAQFRLWWALDYPDGRQATVGALVDVVWDDRDWQLVFDEPAMDLRGLQPQDSYLIWGPQ
jgi:hypothetical protein